MNNFNIIQITWPSVALTVSSLDPSAVEWLASTATFEDAIILGKTHCQMIDMAPTILVHDVEKDEWTEAG